MNTVMLDLSTMLTLWLGFSGICILLVLILGQLFKIAELLGEEEEP